ncbi:hypothetical protein [Pandoraea bronchicola]|uniref:Uncharacterized protein n=1 Tax=Pandoraea bronchicola TaxID=2508287 RepID=A0A5E5BZG6_9BURK|nr:hypothetical protein [Pandoraea bronchicola]VVE90502.1 hypothetical protein PBR20603_04487 [Pandoraea bronchicola]
MKEQFLDKPLLPQASRGVLNVSSVKSSVIVVKIPPYEQIDDGDKVTVRFNGQEGQRDFERYSYILSGQSFPPLGLEVDIQPLSVLRNGKYVVTYQIESRAGNIARSDETGIVVSNEKSLESDVQYHQATYLGEYLSGVVDSWVVPFAYSITSESDVKSVKWPDASGQVPAKLTLYRRPSGQKQVKVGDLTYASGIWQFALSAGPVNVSAGDELSFYLSADTSLSVSVTV